MKLWYPLKLTPTILNDKGIEMAKNPKPGWLKTYECILDPVDVLDTSVIEMFKNLEMDLWCVVFFAIPNSANGSLERNTIHTDVTGLGNGQWQSVNYGISFEANHTTKSTFHWFDASAYPACYPTFPQEEHTKSEIILHGVHYGARRQQGILPNVKEIDRAPITQPLLVRTDVPHCVSYNTSEGVRCGVSLRFKNHSDPFDQVVQRLTSIIN